MGQLIGFRFMRQPTERSISCEHPLGWFDINKTVRFRVFGVDYHAETDRAPNALGLRYRGL